MISQWHCNVKWDAMESIDICLLMFSWLLMFVTLCQKKSFWSDSMSQFVCFQLEMLHQGQQTVVYSWVSSVFSSLIKIRRPDCKIRNKKYIVNKETTCLNQFSCLLSASGYCHNSVWSKHYLLVKKHLPFRCYITGKGYITEVTVQGRLFLKFVQKHFKWPYLMHRVRFINQTQKWSKFCKTWGDRKEFEAVWS